MKMIRIIYLLVLSFSICAGAAQPDKEEPQLDLGAGPLAVVGNHYRGSDQSKIWVFPIPYFFYRSEHLEAEPSFIRGLLFHNHWFSFKLSLVPGLNVESRGNRARAGMPVIDYSLEAGPMAIVRLWENEGRTLLINFEVPVRESFAVNTKTIRAAGLIAVPYVNLIYKPREPGWTFDSEFSVSPMFASKKYHDRFYTVAPQFQTSDRPAFSAHGGYSGLQSALVFNKRAGNTAILSFLRWDYLQGAVFQSSPLVKKKHFLIGGLGVFWMFR